jgi:predicted AAA+ superfamily ATPase
MGEINVEGNHEKQVYEKLVQWRNKRGRKPLAIKGARQVGKTWLIRKSGEMQFGSFAYINCDSNGYPKCSNMTMM